MPPTVGPCTRPDTSQLVQLLLSFGADPNQRGHNDYTVLHVAVAEENLEAIQMLLQARADPEFRTRIDDCETPLELAERRRAAACARLLRRAEQG